MQRRGFAIQRRLNDMLRARTKENEGDLWSKEQILNSEFAIGTFRHNCISLPLTWLLFAQLRPVSHLDWTHQEFHPL